MSTDVEGRTGPSASAAERRDALSERPFEGY